MLTDYDTIVSQWGLELEETPSFTHTHTQESRCKGNFVKSRLYIFDSRGKTKDSGIVCIKLLHPAFSRFLIGRSTGTGELQ